MNLQDMYLKETGDQPKQMITTNGGVCYTHDYVDWLEEKTRAALTGCASFKGRRKFLKLLDVLEKSTKCPHCGNDMSGEYCIKHQCGKCLKKWVQKN